MPENDDMILLLSYFGHAVKEGGVPVPLHKPQILSLLMPEIVLYFQSRIIYSQAVYLMRFSFRAVSKLVYA